jgi:hypothetical protein
MVFRLAAVLDILRSLDFTADLVIAAVLGLLRHLNKLTAQVRLAALIKLAAVLEFSVLFGLASFCKADLSKTSCFFPVKRTCLRLAFPGKPT